MLIRIGYKSCDAIARTGIRAAIEVLDRVLIVQILEQLTSEMCGECGLDTLVFKRLKVDAYAETCVGPIKPDP